VVLGTRWEKERGKEGEKFVGGKNTWGKNKSLGVFQSHETLKTVGHKEKRTVKKPADA